MRGIQMLTAEPIVVPDASWRADRAPRWCNGQRTPRFDAPSLARPTDAGRLWKCRGRGNHRPISTAAWKSREEREIPTFPQAASWLS